MQECNKPKFINNPNYQEPILELKGHSDDAHSGFPQTPGGSAACVCVQRDSLVFAALADVTLARKKEKEKHLILFPLSCAPITVFICPWADFNSAQQQESCVCVLQEQCSGPY